jgi:hypothetical protein
MTAGARRLNPVALSDLPVAPTVPRGPDPDHAPRCFYMALIGTVRPWSACLQLTTNPDHNRNRHEPILADPSWLQTQVSDGIRQPARILQAGARLLLRRWPAAGVDACGPAPSQLL